MNFEFNPWKLDIDVDGTRNLYKDNDYSINKQWNKLLIDLLGDFEKDILEKAGIDLDRVPVKKIVWKLTEEDDGINQEVIKVSADFAIKGELLEIPKWQEDILGDKELLGKVPADIKVVENEDEFEELLAYPLTNLKGGVVFKPPYSKVEDEKLHTWHSGYVVASVLIILK